MYTFTGAKLITPFGLLGACSTRGFKRRLREQYHRPGLPLSSNTGEAVETIRLGAFMRDFVIEFGPADVEDKPGQANTKVQVPQVDEHRGSQSNEM